MTHEWQSIETAPKDGTVILIANEEKQFVVAGWWSGDALYPWEFVDGTEHYLDRHMEDDPGLIQFNAWPDPGPTHWQPFPSPPEELI